MEKLGGKQLTPLGESYKLQGFFDEDADFLMSVLNHGSPLVSLEESRQSVEIADAMRARDETYRRKE
jgi:hypothetical protein